jgi:hypothetical protein
MRDYSEKHCWQYDIRLKNIDLDLKEANFTENYTHNLTVNDFEYKHVVDTKEKQELKKFIERHEWLGNLSQMTTHWFGAYHNGKLAGVILFNMPNAFSKILGENTPDLERLISRGACISWSPKCLASSFMMWCINWMVKNTQYRLFTAYSDPEAKELGTIYQACNFYYLGKNSGTLTRYINPYSGKIVSDRYFRTTSAYKKYAKELGIQWQKSWNKPNGRINISAVPKEIMDQLRKKSKEKISETQPIISTYKHKYVYVLGENKKETKKLRKEFELRNKTFPYPKERGQ